jgi:hypothetical protein
MKPVKFLITLSLLFVLTFQPIAIFAQISGGGGGGGGTVGGGGSGGSGTGSGTVGGGTSGGTGTGAGTVSGGTSNTTYNPSSSTAGNGKTFSGSSFSGIGGAVAGCANVGGLLVGAVSGLFNKDKDSSTSSSGQKVPTSAEDTVKKVGKVEDQQKKTNRTKECLDGIAYAAAKTLLQQVSSKTLTWINKGLGGNPTYVQDITSQLQSVRDEKLQSYLNTAQNSNSIFGNALRSTITQQTTGITDGYLNKVMNTPEARQYDAFQKDFSSGGWGALLNMNNNPIGATFNSAEKLQKAIDTNQEALTNEVQRNDGFLDMRTCVEYESANTPHSWEDADPDPTTTTNTNPTGTARKCLRYKTVTPGSLISSQAQEILGSPTRQLELADSINEILGAVFDQILNGLMQDGLNSLQNSRSRTASNFSGLGTNVVLGTNGLPIGSGSAGDAFGYQLPGNGYDVQDFDISRPQMLRAITQAQYDFVNRSKDSQIAMRTIVPTLGALDYCIPGPNPSWQDGLSGNFQSFIQSFATPSKDRTFAGKFLSAATSSTIQALVKLFGGGGDTKELNAVLGGQPELFDKASGENKELSVWTYQYFTSDYRRLVKNTDGNWIRNWIEDGYQRIVEKYKVNFTETKIVDLFRAVDPDQQRARGNIRESIKETAKLIQYSENITSLDQDYTTAIADKEDTIAELEEIRLEALAIVKKAKARHIAEQAAAGTPVKMSCIDRAYVIDESALTGPARQESDVPNPIIQESARASAYFYSQL